MDAQAKLQQEPPLPQPDDNPLPFLPRMPSASGVQITASQVEEQHPHHHQHAAVSRHRAHLAETPPPRHVPRSHHPQLTGNVEFLQTMLRDRDMELLRLRHENSLLKQIERRQQKDLEQLEWQSEERVIHSLRDEVTGLKNKLKIYFAQLTSNARDLRHMSEDRQRLKDQNAKLERLAADRHLAEREHLNAEVEALAKRLGELDHIAGDAVKRAELTEKNMTIDNRHLRGKLAAMEREVTEAREEAARFEGLVKDREKEICSLEIYRYNAVHRKADTVCKNCHIRDKEAVDRKRLADITAKLPTLRTPTLEESTANTLIIGYVKPRHTKNSEQPVIEYSRLSLLCSPDPAMERDVNTTTLDGGDQHEDSNHGETKGLSLDKRGRKKTVKPEAEVISPERHCRVSITDLKAGTKYYIKLTSGHHEPAGINLITDEASSDVPAGDEAIQQPVPVKPPKLDVERLTDTSVRVFADVRATEDFITMYRVSMRHVSGRSKQEEAQVNAEGEISGETKEGIRETLVELLASGDLSGSYFTHTLDDLEVGSSYAFSLQCCNEAGWSDTSETSDTIFLAPRVEVQPAAEPRVVEPDSAVSDAAAIALPPSPLPPQEDPDEDNPPPVTDSQPAEQPTEATSVEAALPAADEADEATDMGRLVKANSKTGSNLTLDQRVENMHHGMPAYYEPPAKADS
ncbi:hypothetical protein HKX48_005165 [Thoreauomyces humboldtii]|nr:hypothetical protein HKX48_005165 [Thoreauomyces humboldtii]